MADTAGINRPSITTFEKIPFAITYALNASRRSARAAYSIACSARNTSPPLERIAFPRRVTKRKRSIWEQSSIEARTISSFCFSLFFIFCPPVFYPILLPLLSSHRFTSPNLPPISAFSKKTFHFEINLPAKTPPLVDVPLKILYSGYIILKNDAARGYIYGS